MNRSIKYILFALIIVIAFSAFSQALIRKGTISKAPDHDLHSIIVKFKPHVISLPNGGYTVTTNEAVINAAAINSLNVKYKVSTLKKIFRYAEEGVTRVWNRHRKLVDIEDLSGYYKIYFPDDVDVNKALEDYKADPNVETAELDHIAHMTVIPSDTNFNLQWGLSNEGQAGGTPGCDIKAPQAWDICKGTSEVIIAIVDSGVQTNHPDLASKLIIRSGCNFVEGGKDPNPRPSSSPGADNSGCDHGTHVAGIAAAVTNNSTPYGSVAGVAWNCSIMPVKVLDNSGSGSYSAIAQGIEFAANNGADVINLSLGGPYSSFLQSAIDNAYALGCVIVAAAGNDNVDISFGSNMESPVCNDGGDGVNRVVGVAATDNTDHTTWYSNYSSIYVDVSAPGGYGDFPPDSADIYSTIYHNPSFGFSNWFDYLAGTSMATPFVSGLAALIFSRYPGIDNASVINILMNSTDYIDNLNPSYAGKIGTGRINAFSAMTLGTYAIISYPRQSNTVYGIVNIRGSATWEGSGFYRVSTAEGALPSPGAYRSLNLSGTIVDNGPLATWDTTGLSGTYTIKLSINDIDLASYEVTHVVYVGNDPKRVRLLSRAIGGPNPYNPSKEPKFVFYYVLSANADTNVAIYNMNGALLWKKKFFAGENGARQGENTVDWKGESVFGKALTNGIYLYQIISGDRLIGRDKIIIFR